MGGWGGEMPGTRMQIADIEAFPLSVRVENGARLSIGTAVKRDTVVVRVRTECGLVGYGESHHARSAGIIAQIVNTTLRDLILPASAADVVDIWSGIYNWQLRSHGLGAAAVMAMSGIDMALWDIRAKAIGWPLYKVLGGKRKRIKAYAGGVALGWQEPERLVDEVALQVELGFKAVKLRVGDTPRRDSERVAAVRKAFGSDLRIMVDANTGYTLEDVRAVMPAFEELAVYWLEEPFPPHDHKSYLAAARLGKLALAAGENHYTRFEFTRMVEDGAVAFLQPDLSKTGGITEGLRIAAMASAWKLPICPHSSLTGINMAASMHFLMAIDNAGYFEADVSGNPFREGITGPPFSLSEDGTVAIGDEPGIGLPVDEAFVKAHPFIPGNSFV
jgi:D-galactarolactone cycloisomerase